MTCQLVRSAVMYGGEATNVPLSSGYAAGAAAVNLMSAVVWPGLPIDGNGNPYLYLSASDLIQCTFATALTAATYLNVGAIVSDF